MIPPLCGEGRVGVAASSVPAAPHPTGLWPATPERASLASTPRFANARGGGKRGVCRASSLQSTAHRADWTPGPPARHRPLKCGKFRFHRPAARPTIRRMRWTSYIGEVAFVRIVAWITFGSRAAWMLGISHHTAQLGEPGGRSRRRVARGSVGTYAESSSAGRFWLASRSLWLAANFSAKSRHDFAI